MTEILGSLALKDKFDNTGSLEVLCAPETSMAVKHEILGKKGYVCRTVLQNP